MSNNVSQASLLGLKAITAEHADRFEKEGRAAVRGAKRQAVDKVKDPFLRPSPGLVKRMAQEARNEAKARRFADDGGPSDEQRRAILEAKAKKYEAMKRGDLSGFSERELAESNIDFTRREEWSDHSSDVDESAAAARKGWSDDEVDTLDDMERVEYVDELGRTRFGTRREAKGAERERARSGRGRGEAEAGPSEPAQGSSYAEVQNSTFIHGDQNYFPVYQPDPEAMKRKYMEAEAEARAHHYDSTKEVRVRGAGAYQFSLDEEKRAAQMASLEAERLETEIARDGATKRKGSAARQAHNDRMEKRRALVEAKRAKLLGGPDKLAELRRQRRAQEADELFEALDDHIRRSMSPQKRA